MTTPSMFFRLTTDKRRIPLTLEHQFQSAISPACWLIGAGPSLNQVDWNLVHNTPIPRMAINLAGHQLTQPHFWTAYDPTQRFHQSTYLNASILKFVHARRANDLIPQTTLKVCDAPNIAFFESERTRGYHNFLDPLSRKLIDWNDSFVQAIDLLYRLGFRRIFCLGCELFIPPTGNSIKGHIPRLKDHAPQDEADVKQKLQQYHFEETKPLKATINTDEHYFRIVQALRLSRSNMSAAGLQLISATTCSRLNDFFPVQSVSEIRHRICQEIGNPTQEQTLGRYTKTESRSAPIKGQMVDFQPPSWAKKPAPHKQSREKTSSQQTTPFADQAAFSTPSPHLVKRLNQLKKSTCSLNEHA